MGFREAQRQLTTYLSDPQWCPLADLVLERMAGLDPARSHRLPGEGCCHGAGDLSHVEAAGGDAGEDGGADGTALSRHDRGETSLQFMGLPDREALGNYRVKIYG